MEPLKNPIACPRCGEPMNHHADKLIYALEATSEEVLEEFHWCTSCGAGVSARQTGFSAN